MVTGDSSRHRFFFLLYLKWDVSLDEALMRKVMSIILCFFLEWYELCDDTLGKRVCYAIKEDSLPKGDSVSVISFSIGRFRIVGVVALTFWNVMERLF